MKKVDRDGARAREARTRYRQSLEATLYYHLEHLKFAVRHGHCADTLSRRVWHQRLEHGIRLADNIPSLMRELAQAFADERGGGRRSHTTSPAQRTGR